MQPIARIVAGLVEFDLTHLEHINLHHAVRRWHQDGRWLDRLRSFCRPEDFEVRRLTPQAVDQVQINGGPVRVRQAGQDRQSTHDDWRVTDESASLDDTLHDRSHRVADKRDPATRHESTGHRASMP